MTEFRFRLAGRVIAVSVQFPSTAAFCADYISDGPVDFSVSVLPADLEDERETSIRCAALEGLPPQQFSDAYLERLALYRKIAERMPEYDTVLFHGSALALDGRGYLFTAKSGTGKSTHARLWRECFGPRVMMVNDDKPLLRITEGGVLVCGTPWTGKHRLGSNAAVPLKAICLLERSPENHIEPVSFREALPKLLQQSYRPVDAAALGKSLELLHRLGSTVELFRLQCNMDPAAAETACAGISGGYLK